MNVTYEYVLELAKQLKPAEQTALIENLKAAQSGQITRELLLAEFERRWSMGGAETDNLYFGKYANPDINISAEELEATIHEAANAWEEELDEYNN